MRKSRHFSPEALLATIQEAEDLARQVEALDENQEQMSLIYRWAEVADEVAKMMVMAEELLTSQELLALQARVNAQDWRRWDKYRRNIRWMNKPLE
jgi:hypothetical protein